MKQLSITFLIGTVVALMIAGCNSGTQPESNSTEIRDTVDTVKDTSTQTTEDFFYSLPSPLVMVKFFKRAGLKYVEGVANTPDNLSKYTSLDRKTLNMGVYSADLAYCILNHQPQQASKYMKCIKLLSDDLGMAAFFNTDDYLTRFKNNLSSEYSLLQIVSGLKSDIDIFMRDQNKEKQTLLIFIGAWAENMYIATQLTKDLNKEKIATRIAEQKYILTSLMNSVVKYQNDSDFSKIFSKLDDLKILFNNLPLQEETEKPIVDELQLKSITEKVSRLRKTIIE